MSSRLHILLVDDNAQDYANITNLLTEIDGCQYDLEQAASYDLALEKITEAQPDVCLLNPNLSSRHGFEPLRQAFENGTATSLILLTGSDPLEPPPGQIEATAVDFLAKDGLTPAALKHSLHHALKYRRLKNSLAQTLTTLQADNKRLQAELMQWQHEAAVRQEREAIYQDLFNIDVYGVEVLDPHGIITDCNKTFQELLGHSADEIIGQPATAFVVAADQARLEEKLAELPEQGYAEGEFELLCADGSTRLVWRRLRATHERGIFTGGVAYSRDITERMTAVRQISTLARALEQSPVAILITDATGRIEYLNFGFSELTGYSYDEAMGQPFSQIKGVDPEADTFQEMWQTITAGEEWQGELQSRSKEGELYWEALTIAPMFNPQGGITNFVAIQEEITERKQRETEAIDSQQRVGSLMSAHINSLTVTNERLEREIAERQRVESELRHSQTRLRAQYKGIPVPTYSWQRHGDDLVLVDFNDVAEKESQGRIKDFMGQAVRRVFKDNPQVLADFEQCVRDKGTVRREAPYQLITTGEIKYYVTTYNYVPPDLVVVHIQDITVQKRLEEQLNAQQSRQARFADQSAELARVKSALQDEVIKRRETEIKFKHYREQVERSPESHYAELNELKRTLKQETAKRQQAELTLQESQEKLQQIAQNIDNRLREQYRSIPVPTYSWQRIADEFILIDFNDAAAESMGKIVDFFGKTASEIFKERPDVLADFERCFQEKTKVVREAPYTLITSGETRYFVTTYNFVPPNLVIDHIQDITEQKKMEAELADYRRRFEAQTAKLAELEQRLAPVEPPKPAQPEKQPPPAPGQLETVVKARTAELTRLNQQLQREVFEHQRAEESLREARARIRAQYKGIPIPTYTWRRVGDDFVLVDYNQAAEKSSQGRIAKFMSKPAGDIFKDRPQVLADFARCFREKRRLVREAPYRLVTTGELRYFITTYNFAPPNVIIVYIQDVTEIKQLEISLRESLDYIELNFRLSADGRITEVNEATCWFFGQTREQLVGQPLPFLVDSEQKRLRHHLKSLTPQGPTGVIKVQVNKRDGSPGRQQWRTEATFSDRGRLVEVKVTGKNINEEPN